jgi:SHS family lactate transporter-like MFS transporter
VLTAWRELDRGARRTFAASFLGWSLDAFDYFLLTFVLVRIATDFGHAVTDIALALTLTLACRPVGALLFGWLADRYGRRTPLMIDVACYSLIELLTAFAPNFVAFLVLRALYGIAMGGEWGVGAAIAMEAVPAQRRGLFSGILQEGYMVGYLFAAAAYFVVFKLTALAGLQSIDWRILFAVGSLPAFLVLYIRAYVPDTKPTVTPDQPRASIDAFREIARNWPLAVYAVAFMTGMNFMSHGTQDLYATFLQRQHGFAAEVVFALSAIGAIGAIAGGIVFGAFSQRIGRRPAIVICAVLGMAIVPLWAFSHSVALLACGAFAIQFAVQGAWGVIPAHLNELSPPAARATFPGFTYQLGNAFSAVVPLLIAWLATKFRPAGGPPDYAKAMALVAGVTFLAVIALALSGYAVRPEARDRALRSA